MKNLKIPWKSQGKLKEFRSLKNVATLVSVVAELEQKSRFAQHPYRMGFVPVSHHFFSYMSTLS